MNIRRTKAFGIYGIPMLVLLATLVAGAAHWRSIEQDAYRNGPPKRYGVIWPHKLTRSGLPYSDQGWTWLRKQGVRSIITFRKQNDVDYRKFGFAHVLRVPLTHSVMPTEETATEYLKFIQNPANQPVHIHCSAGRGRTGMMAARARYSVDGWTLTRALDEARTYRDGKELSPRRVAWLRAWAKAHPPGSFKFRP
ncbi:MAG: tyrosine-protein phosphatase [Acidobacteriaceae bacterium]|nr:tyrosine-protein phosphatase [Acidobacteriaceae bacterium]